MTTENRLTCCSCGADLGDADDPYRDPDCGECARKEMEAELAAEQENQVNLEREIPEEGLAIVEERVAKFNKRLAKRGFPALTLTILNRKLLATSQIDRVTGEPIRVPWLDVVLTGERPRFPGGWTLLGLVDHTADGMLRSVPGKQIPESQRERGNICDHCGKRRSRSQTFVLQNDAGEITQVGRSCLRDFLGHDPSGALWWFDNSPDDKSDDFFGGLSYRMPNASRLTVLAATFAILERHGWVSRKRAEYEIGSSRSTADYVGYLLNPPVGTDARWKDHDEVMAIQVTPEHMQTARDAANHWVTSTDGSDFAFNLRKNCQNADEPYADRVFGTLVAGAAMYLRHLDQLRERERLARRTGASEWVGAIKDRVDLEAQVIQTRNCESDWGVSVLVKMVDTNGNVLTTFATGSNFEAPKVGETWTIRGTVKKHGEYKGIKETTLSRVVFKTLVRTIEK